MGKTLGNILAVAAAIAVNVIPGVGQALSAAIGATLATAAISAVTLYGLQSGVSLLGLGPGAPKPDTTETAIKTSRPPRVSAYGRSRLYGAYALYETASNGTAVDSYAVHDGELDAIEQYYLGDEPVTLTGTTVNEGADGRYRDGAVNIYATDGSVPGAGFPALTALLGGIWTAAHRGDGIVALALTAKSVKAKYFQETYPASSVPVPSIVARWQKCPDPAAVDPLDESGWTWTENPVRQLLHYKLVREGPRPALAKSDPGYEAALAVLRSAWWSRKIAPTLQYWVDAAADCDSAVPLKAGGTEPRYRSEVAHKHTDDHKGPISNFLATFDGWIAPRSDGALVVYSGRYYAPDPVDDLIGPDEIVSYSWEGGAVDDGEAVNEVVCGYISAEHDFNSVETDAWRDETDIAARGKVLSAPLEAQVPSHGQSRRLAKRRISRSLAVNRGTVTTNIAGRHARGKRYIWLRLAEAGTVFYDGPAEILSLTRAVRGGVTFSWVAADPNVDNWNPAAEEGDPAALGNRVAQQPLIAPAIDSVTPVYDGTGAQLEIEATGPDRDDLQWYVHWREVGAGVWGPDQEFTDAATGAAVSLVAGPVPGDTLLEVEIAYRTGDGRYSPWSAAVSSDVGTPPENLSRLTLRAAALSVYDVTRRSNFASLNDGTGAVASGDPVGFVRDLMAPDAPLASPDNAGSRPAATLGLTFGGDDRLLSAFAAGSGPASATLVFFYRGTDTQFVLASNAAGGTAVADRVAIAADGSGSDAGAGSTYVDGVAVATRDALHDAACDGLPHIIEVRAVDLSTWTGITLGTLQGSPGSWYVTGAAALVAVIDNSKSDAENARLDAYAAAGDMIAALGL